MHQLMQQIVKAQAQTHEMMGRLVHAIETDALPAPVARPAVPLLAPPAVPIPAEPLLLLPP